MKGLRPVQEALANPLLCPGRMVMNLACAWGHPLGFGDTRGPSLSNDV